MTTTASLLLNNFVSLDGEHTHCAAGFDVFHVSLSDALRPLLGTTPGRDPHRRQRWGLRSQSEHAALGVIGMRERLEIVSGTLKVESAPDEGTTLYTRVPLQLPD